MFHELDVTVSASNLKRFSQSRCKPRLTRRRTTETLHESECTTQSRESTLIHMTLSIINRNASFWSNSHPARWGSRLARLIAFVLTVWAFFSLG